MMASNAEASFSYYRTITIDHTDVPSTQTNFPVLISTTTADLATTGNGGDVTDAEGDDIGFYTNTDCSTGKMDWETELYTAATGRVVYWVRVASLDSGTDTVFYLCYGDSGITTDQSNKTGVWDSDFKGVWHLPNGTTLGALDSTSNGNNGTIYNSVAGTGKIDGGGDFDNSGDYIAVPAINSESQTYETWFKMETKSSGSDPDYQDQLFAKNDYGVNGTVWLSVDGSVSGTLAAYLRSTVSGEVWCTGSTQINTATWYHAALVIDGSANTAQLYLNGATNGASQSFNPDSVSHIIEIGRAGDLGGWSYYFDGIIDETRISNSVRTANWISAEYNNQSNPDGFFSVGAETAIGGGTPAPASTHRRVIITE
jgi:hypothetical protein